MEGITVGAVITNALIVLVTSNQLSFIPTAAERVIWVVIGEHLIIATKITIAALTPDFPVHVEREIAKQDRLGDLMAERLANKLEKQQEENNDWGEDAAGQGGYDEHGSVNASIAEKEFAV